MIECKQLIPGRMYRVTTSLVGREPKNKGLNTRNSATVILEGELLFLVKYSDGDSVAYMLNKQGTVLYFWIHPLFLESLEDV